MAKSELERLVSLGLISAWEASKVRRGSKDNSHVDTRDYLSAGRGDDAAEGGHEGHDAVRLMDHIDARDLQKPGRGSGFSDPKQMSARFPTGGGHINERKPAGGSWERPRPADARWTARTPSVARARASSDSEWNPAWFFGTPETRQK